MVEGPATQKGAMPARQSRPFMDRVMRSGAELNRKLLVGGKVDVSAQKVIDDPCKVRAR
jgi:hypothetical protein